MSAYKPGTVAVATVRGVKGVRVFRTESEWCDEPGNGREAYEVTDILPLVVLDLAQCPSTHWVRALRRLLPDDVEAWDDGEVFVSAIADQIEAQTETPRIPEPNACGATVIASQTGEIEGSDRLWVRFRHGKSDCWIDQYEHVRSWDDLDNPCVSDCEAQS